MKNIKMGRLSIYAITYLFAFIAILPFIWSALLSTQSSSQIVSASLLPGSDFFENIKALLHKTNIFIALFNTVIVTFFSTVLAVFICACTGYVFAIYEFKFKKTMFSFLLATMMVPSVVNVIPYVIIIDKLYILDTLAAIWLPAGVSVFGVFLVRQYVSNSISKELFDAGKLDYANELQIFFYIILPLLKNVLITIAIIIAVASWNNFLYPLVALQSPNKQIVSLSLRSLVGINETPWNVLMTGSFLAMLPMLVAFIFFSNRMIKSLSSGSKQ